MSECVVRMEMPKRCAECPLSCQMYGDTPCYCKVAFEENEAVEGGLMWKETDPTKRPSWCPIICSLPEGHGRLVDADAFEKDVSDALVYGLKEILNEEGKQIFHVLMQEVLDNVKKRKTIVPAEAESPSPKPTDPVPIRDVYYVMTECDVKTGTVTYELRERRET